MGNNASPRAVHPESSFTGEAPATHNSTVENRSFSPGNQGGSEVHHNVQENNVSPVHNEVAPVEHRDVAPVEHHESAPQVQPNDFHPQVEHHESAPVQHQSAPSHPSGGNNHSSGGNRGGDDKKH